MRRRLGESASSGSEEKAMTAERIGRRSLNRAGGAKVLRKSSAASAAPMRSRRDPAHGIAAEPLGEGSVGTNPPSYLILASLNSTCLRATGSYLRKLIFSVVFRGFFFVT